MQEQVQVKVLVRMHEVQDEVCVHYAGEVSQQVDHHA